MKEWDLASYHRKYKNTAMRLIKRTTGTVEDVRCRDINEEHWFVSLAEDDGDVIPLERSKWEAEYVHAKCGFMPDGRLLLRRNIQVFNVGICPTSHQLLSYLPKLELFQDRADFETKEWRTFTIGKTELPITMVTKKKAVESYGPISKALFLSPNYVFYYDTPIGKREGTKFQLIHPAFQQELDDALRGVL